MSWRPEGWVNPHNMAVAKYPRPTLLLLPDGRQIEGAYTNQIGLDSFEAGADAILEALRKRGYPSDNPSISISHLDAIKAECKGTWVFIPDDDTSDESPQKPPEPHAYDEG